MTIHYWSRGRRNGLEIGWPGMLKYGIRSLTGRVKLDARNLYRIVVYDPWPWMRIGLLPEDWYDFPRHAIRLFRDDSELLSQQERVVEDVVRWAERHAQHVVIDRGWLNAARVEPEPIARWPDPSDGAVGGYRRQAGGEPLAEDPTPNVFERLLAWLASTPDKRWTNTPRRLTVTRAHLCYETYQGDLCRYPLSQLRTASPGGGGDRVFVFGRNGRVVIPAGRAAPVVAALDAHLAQRADELRDPQAGRLDLNTASPLQLEHLPHVGPRRAREIVALRKRRGAFRGTQELMVVEGIGPTHFSDIAAHVWVKRTTG